MWLMDHTPVKAALFGLVCLLMSCSCAKIGNKGENSMENKETVKPAVFDRFDDLNGKFHRLFPQF